MAAFEEITQPQAKLYESEHGPITGQGMFANVNIARGERILAEEALVEFSFHKCVKFDRFRAGYYKSVVESLPVEKRQQFYSLGNAWGDNTVRGIFHTNYILHSEEGTGGVFWEASRINHSCQPNAYAHWNTNLNMLTVHALRDILEGHEIMINYNQRQDMPYQERKEHLQACFNFTCQCPWCSLPEDLREAQDNAMKLYRSFFCKPRLQDVDVRQAFEKDARVQLKYISWALNALNQAELLGPDDRVDVVLFYKLCRAAYRECMGAMDLSSAKEFLLKAYEGRCVMEGSDSPDTIAMKEALDHLRRVKSPDTLAQTLSEVECAKWRLRRN